MFVLVPKLDLPDFWKEKPIEFLFMVSRQPDGKRKLFTGASGDSGTASAVNEVDAFSGSQVVFVNTLNKFKLTKGRHVLMHDGGPTARDPGSEDYKVRVVLEAS